MASYVETLYDRQLLPDAPSFLPHNVHYECIMGSMAYGVSNDNSDMDIYGFCIPPKEMVFPHLAGHVYGFGPGPKTFHQWDPHAIMDPQARGGKGQEFDFAIFNIVKYFSLCADCNPNMIDSLFVAQEHITKISSIGNMVRENRHLFLHKGAWHRFKGYAYSQSKKMRNKKPKGKRLETVEKYGFDVKFAYHLVRLMDEVEQILTERTINLQRNREQLKAIRRGEWSEQDVMDHFNRKESELEAVYSRSKLQKFPDMDKIKELLLNCLEHHYGNLDKAVVRQDKSDRVLFNIIDLINAWWASQKKDGNV